MSHGHFTAERGDRAGGWLAQTRSEVLALNGMVATSQPLAAQAGLDILKRGGNAFDAAVATAAVLGVVEPGSAGLGGDVFVLAWHARERQLIALNGCGRAPGAATLSHLAQRGFGPGRPASGIDAVTIPGAVDAFDVLLRRAGTMSFGEVLEPAAAIAEAGFAVSERVQQDWCEAAGLLAADADSCRSQLVDGAAPARYSVFRNPDQARALRLLQAEGRDGFYNGAIGAALLAKSRALGGRISPQDLAAAHADWVQPLSTRFRGHDVFEFPPSTQGFAALLMLNLIEAISRRHGLDLAALGPASPLYWHVLIEAKKLAYADLYAHNGDPDFVDVPTTQLLSDDYASELAARVDLTRAATPPLRGDPVGGTVYIATADAAGNLVSFIYSVYHGFGSGITVPGFGFTLNDRGALFSLDPASPNRLEPHKRPFHTLLPGFVMREGNPVLSFGLMGGAQQAQGHAQVLVNLLAHGANLQAASDAARFAHAQLTNTVHLESALHARLAGALTDLGHQVALANGEMMGGYQAIGRSPDGVYRGASDHRKDGQAVGW